MAAQAQLLSQQPFAKELAQQQAEALRQQAKAAEELARAEYERIEAAQRSAQSAEDALQRLLDEERALVIAAERHITLAQALEEVAMARLRERQAALMAEGDRDAEVLAIQREIDARKQLAEAIGRKEAREAAAESARAAASEWARTAERIQSTITDALMRGFESGKSFAANLRDTIVNMFKTLVIRPVIQAIVAPVAGSIAGTLGVPSAAHAGQGVDGVLSSISGLKSVYDTIIGGFTSLGNSVAFAAQDIGAWLVSNTTGVLNKLGGSMMANAGAIGTAGSYLGAAGAGVGLGSMLAGQYKLAGLGGATSSVMGSAIGGAFFGPLGAAIGGAVGGLVNRLFGRKLQDVGIEGTFSDSGFAGSLYTYYKGGLFSSSKTVRSEIAPEIKSLLDNGYLAMRSSAIKMAQALGIGSESLESFTDNIKVSIKGLDPQQVQAKIAEVMAGVGEKMAEALLSGSEAVIRAGETAGQALQRLGGSLLAVNDAFEAFGVQTLDASIASGEAASKIVEAFGGLSQFTEATSAYFRALYSDAEQATYALGKLVDAFAALGFEIPGSTAALRELVKAQDLTTEAGRKAFASLVQLGPAFASVMQQMQQSIGLTVDALRGIFQKVLAEAKTAEEARLLAEQAAGKLLIDAIGNALINTITNIVSAAILQPITQTIVSAASQAAMIDVSAATTAGANIAAGGAAAAQGLADIVGRAIEVTNAMAGILSSKEFQQAFSGAVSAIGAVSAGLFSGMTSVSSGGGFGGGAADRMSELLAERRKLEIELMEAQGRKQEALNAIRADAIKGLTEEAIAIYDANQALREHIDALREQARVAEERASLETRLYQLLGYQNAINAREREKLDASNWDLFDSIVALERAQAAAEAALDTLSNAVRAEQQLLREQFERESDILRDRISAISSVVLKLNSALDASREKLRSDSIASQTAARLTLQSIVTAVRGGADISIFGDAIEQALGVLNVNDPTLYASREEFLRNQAKTTDTIRELAELGGNQLDVAERQLVALQEGFKAEIARLDGIIEAAKQQIIATLGVQNGVAGVNASVLSVRDALQPFTASISPVSYT
ncbi:MAG: hypothetical protein N2690_03925, partial [Rhodocyclaceae bacterium]|nr:hypothetical protein [Rhodocyclaceae bacterium]